MMKMDWGWLKAVRRDVWKYDSRRKDMELRRTSKSYPPVYMAMTVRRTLAHQDHNDKAKWLMSYTRQRTLPQAS